MADAPASSIADLRKRLGLTLEGFAAALELRSKGQASEIESTGRCSAEVALRVEALSGGEIDAASLNDVVALVRRARPTPGSQEQAA